MKIKDLQEGVNVHKGFSLPNYEDAYISVWSLGYDVLKYWKEKMKFTGEEECHITIELGRTIVFVPSIEERRNNFINGKAAMLSSWNTNN